MSVVCGQPVRAERMQLDPPERLGGSEYSAIANVSPEGAGWRLGRTTAMALEDSLHRRGWPEGAICEPEEVLAARFGVGIRLMRQAFRILQARGACRLQRGRRGGLVVLRPELDATAAAVADTLRWSGVTAEDVQEGRAFLSSLEAASSPNPPFGLAVACFDKLEAAASDKPPCAPAMSGGAEASGVNLASHVAWRITQGITHEGCRTQQRLGTLWELADHYGVSLAVIIDAVRILEDAEVAACVKGRTGGVTLRLPSGDAVVTAVHAYLAAAGATEAQCVAICQPLNLRAARLAAERRSPDGLEQVGEALEAMRAARGAGVMRTWYELQKVLHEQAGNCALHLITRCLAAFTVRSSAIDAAVPPEDFLRRITQAAAVVVEGVRRGDPDLAGEGMIAARRVLDERTTAFAAP